MRPIPFNSLDAIDSPADEANHSSFLFDQFRRRVARSKRETPTGVVPHPELTPQQRQHIQARSINPMSGAGAGGFGSGSSGGGVPIRRFGGTGGSVAERVMIFERCPVFGTDGRAGGAATATPGEKPNWRANLPDTNNRVS